MVKRCLISLNDNIDTAVAKGTMGKSHLLPYFYHKVSLFII
ncbi:hypothetical protein CNO14_07350 (plasmid) [Borrelia miyamotoi]|uniref:Uncharacterized protein n=1 Tax=Borrelia miyamotoi TaxID=47466 RepID=A0AAQ3HEI5_9SPIR|nr:hypothetical protein [Borrelia miyamotoi]WAZ71317.1 hypothetical protein O5403_06635 [Borrelia miyamotoi]WCL22208.1 hypothetical protein CNO10_07500 [Borrelia miyamotoi]WDE70411.1 hypothetical protein CNO12_07395 [Borrelia miyamotoi]WDE71749.1 hypothetical protein CNO13_07085 [Borrelia miyamotoi]WDE73227.1 hypothetical protein CNO14_07350 [Borrelia miyamotoi]